MCCMSLCWLSAQHLNWTLSSFRINISLGGEGITFLSQNTVFLLLNFERKKKKQNTRTCEMLGTSQEKNWNPFLSPASACWGRAHIWGVTWGTTWYSSTEEIQWPVWGQNTRFVSRKVLNYTKTKRLGSPAQRWGAATPINVVTIKRASFPSKQVFQSSWFIAEDYTASVLRRKLQTLSSFLPCTREQTE